MNKPQKKTYAQLNNKSDEELLKIWQENDEEAWVPEALKTVEQILKERGVEIPPPAKLEDLDKEDEQLTSTTAAAEDSPLPPAVTILKIAKVAKILSWVMLGGWGLLVPLSNLLQGYPATYIIATFISSVAQGALYFFLLQLLGEGIYLLVRIEKNTRREKES